MDVKKETCLKGVFVSLVIGSLGATFVSSPTPLHAATKPNAIVRKMIKAHGGMRKWRKAPTASFVESWTIAGTTQSRTTRITVDQDTRRAYLDFLDSGIRSSWDGHNAWSEGGKPLVSPRFVAHLNYTFLNLPWLTRDPGVILGEPTTGRLRNDPTEFIKIKMAYDPNVGDKSDDYFVLYIDPASYQLKGCEFVVAYAAVLPESGDAHSLQLLIFEEFDRVEKLLVPTRYTIYTMDKKPVYHVQIREWSFSQPFDAARLIIPRGALLDTHFKKKGNK